MKLKSFVSFCKQECWEFIKLAFPVYITTLTSELNNSFIPSVLAGHFGDVRTNYAAVTLSTNIILFTGTFPHLCLSSALNTLASQAYGAGENKYLGTLYQRSVCIHLMMCLPIAVVWLNTENIFTIVGQTAELSTLSGEYVMVYIFILPAYAILYPTMKILQIQEIVLPSTVIFAMGSVIEAIACYLLISLTNMGVRGLACGVVISVYFTAFAHLVYLRTMSVWHRIWGGFKLEALDRWRQYVYLGMPILITTWVEVIVFYNGTILMGAISKTAAYEISMYSIVLNIDLFLFLISYALQSTSSIRIGNLVGEGNFEKMKKVAILSMVIVFITQLLQSSVLLAGRYLWGYIFTSDARIVNGIVSMFYVLAAHHSIDGLVVNFQGILVGIGMQKIGLIIPLLFLVCTLPVASIFTVIAKLGPLGYWLGILIGKVIRAMTLLPISFCWINWEKVGTVDNFEQQFTSSIETSSAHSGTSQFLKSTGEEAYSDDISKKKIFSLLKFKILFTLIFLAIIIDLITCRFTHSKVIFHISASYIKSPIEFCCIQFVPSTVFANSSSNQTIY